MKFNLRYFRDDLRHFLLWMDNLYVRINLNGLKRLKMILDGFNGV